MGAAARKAKRLSSSRPATYTCSTGGAAARGASGRPRGLRGRGADSARPPACGGSRSRPRDPPRVAGGLRGGLVAVVAADVHVLLAGLVEDDAEQLLSTSARRSSAAWKLAGFCVPAVASRITPSVSGATSRASLTGRTGGVSTRSSAFRRRSALITLGRRMWSISVGSGGTGPLVITQRPSPTGLSSGLLSERERVREPGAVVEPEDLVLARAPQVGVEHDRLDPDAANATAEVGHDGRLALPGLGARDLDHARGLVHQELEVGAQRAVALLEVDHPLLTPHQRGACRVRAPAGVRSRPSTGASVCCATSAAVSMRRRNCSSASASRKPPNRPSTAATPNSSGGRGWIGENFGDAGSTIVAIISLLSGDRRLERLRGRRRGRRGVARVGRARGDPQDAAAASVEVSISARGCGRAPSWRATG